MKMKPIIFSWFSLTVLLPGVLSLNCYDCGPDTDGKACLKPTAKMTKTCSVNEVCLSYFFLSQKESNTGAYRLCHSPGRGNACPNLYSWGQQVYKGIMYNCSICRTDNCNKIKFTHLGEIIPEYPKLSCYECNPENHGDLCLDPNNTTEVQCNPKDLNKPLCYTYYIKSNNGNLTGAYRGCAESEYGKRDPCDDFIVSSHKNKHQIMNCTTCTTDTCNGEPLSHPSSATFLHCTSIGSIIVTMLSLILFQDC